MPLMDEFKEERAALKNGTPKEKLSYFWYYYKWHTVAIIAIAFFVVSFVYQFATKKETAFYAVMMNASPVTDGTEYSRAFADYAGIDLNKNEFFFDTSIRVGADDIVGDVNYTTMQKLVVYTAAAELDAMVTDTESFQKYANSYTFYDLRNILTEEQIAEYEPYFYYVDWATVEAIETANTSFDETFVPTYKDPTKPEEMEQPVPVGIYLNSCDDLMKNFYFRGEDVVMGVYGNTTHLETTLKYIDFLMEDAK